MDKFYTLRELPYEYKALAPYISEDHSGRNSELR